MTYNSIHTTFYAYTCSISYGTYGISLLSESIASNIFDTNYLPPPRLSFHGDPELPSHPVHD